jgi:arylsulfatase A-like enzyme
MNRRHFIKAAALGLASSSVLLFAAKASVENKQPNILWILAEDIGLQLGCYGEKLVHTPNLDRLASQGALFMNAFTNAGVCSPSRSSFMTGMYATSIGAHNHRTPPEYAKKLPDGVHVFTKYLQDAKYLTALCELQKTDWNFVPPPRPYDTREWGDLKNNQPFFCQYQFYETHRPFHACTEYPVDREAVVVPPDTPDHPEARQEWAQYLESINILDQKVGELLDKLAQDGLDKNTIIIFSGDNGPHLFRGKRWLYDFGIAMPLIVRSPAHFKPGTVVDELVAALDFAPTFINLAGGDVPGHLQGRIFFGPDKEAEPEYIFATRDRCDTDVDRIRCVRSKRYKYLRNYYPEIPYNESGFGNVDVVKLLETLNEENKLTPAQAAYFKPKPKEEFYDMKLDPWELNNLASFPQHKQLLDMMCAELDK